MSKNESAPTMIIPSGTEIQIDVHGQLSVRTPGNLVIQNSGHYGEIESVHGSIRIEAGAEVEAVAVRCAETCYVQGSLTSWKVKARSIQLEEKAQARVVLQETEQVEIGKNAKLVGNFDSEKELFLLFSRFARQLRTMPFYFERGDSAPPPAQLHPADADSAPPPPPPPAGVRSPGARPVSADPLTTELLDANGELPDQLFFSLVLLERELKNESYGAGSRRVVEEFVRMLRSRDFDGLRDNHANLTQRVVEPGEDLRRALELIANHFTRATPVAEVTEGPAAG